MGGEWQRVAVSDIAEPVLGGTPAKAKPEYWEGGTIPWATAKDIASTNGRFIYGTEKRITWQGLANSAAKLLPPGTIVITARGTVGAIARLGREMTFNQTCYGLVPRGDDISADYLFYTLNATLAEARALTYGTVFETITKKTFDSWNIPLPPLTEQRCIARILGTLDDKIELNRRMNETLEAMAQALFKSWFVDFDPVAVNALKAGNPIPDKFADRAAHYRENLERLGLPEEILRLFPDRFVDSELGPIPEGWETGKLGDLSENVRRSIQPSEIKPNTPYIALEHMPRRSIALSSWGSADGLLSNKLAFQQNEILFGKLRPYFHKVGIAPISGICSTDIVVMKPKDQKWLCFVLAHVASDKFVEYTSAGATGTKMPRTSWKEMARYRITVPPEHIVERFHEQMFMWVEKIIKNIHEARALVALRDTLLPKLISGELRLSDVEKILEDAL